MKCSLCDQPAVVKCVICGELFCISHKLDHVMAFNAYESITPEFSDLDNPEENPA